MRRRANIDVNQQEIVTKLRSCGVSCEPRLSRLGDGIPDLLCGYRGRNVLLEIKRDDQGESRKRLSADESAWHAKWSGQVAVVSDWEQAMAVILEVCR